MEVSLPGKERASAVASIGDWREGPPRCEREREVKTQKSSSEESAQTQSEEKGIDSAHNGSSLLNPPWAISASVSPRRWVPPWVLLPPGLGSGADFLLFRTLRYGVRIDEL